MKMATETVLENNEILEVNETLDEQMSPDYGPCATTYTFCSRSG